MPQRWIEPGWNTIREAFIPFSAGPAQCVGKNLAMMELLIIIGSLVWRYDFVLEDGEGQEVSGFEFEPALKTYMRLYLCFFSSFLEIVFVATWLLTIFTVL